MEGGGDEVKEKRRRRRRRGGPDVDFVLFKLHECH